MENISKDKVEKYLSIVNEKLAQRNKHGELVMAGGASLMMIYNARNSTHDIDALLLNDPPKMVHRST